MDAITRLTHLNCGTLRPPSALLVNGHGSLWGPARQVCHCLLLEAGSRRILVDTGIGTADLPDGGARLGAGMVKTVRPELSPAETALSRLAGLGIRPSEVTDIVITHLDPDHAGGLSDFPDAAVHVSAACLAAALPEPQSRLAGRYQPAQWAFGPRWQPLTPDAAWRGRPAAPIPGLRDAWLVDLSGHTPGHAGVAVRRRDGTWLLHAGDAAFHPATFAGRLSPLGLEFAERTLRTDARAWRESRAWLRGLAASGDVEIITSHHPDPRVE